MMKLRSVIFSAILALLLLGSLISARSVSGQMSGLEDTIVDTGPEHRVQHVVKRSPLLAEIIGPLSRNVREVDETSRSTMVYQRMRVLLTLLRWHLGKAPHVDILQFQNWDKTINIDQLFYVKPTTLWEVQKVILAARALGMRVRATGAGHSRSPLYVDEGNIMLDTRWMTKPGGHLIELNEPTPDRPYKTITAMAGVYCFELNEFMLANDVTIYTEPLNDQETIGGMVAASTHGSTYNWPAISGFVIEMRLLDSNARLRHFTVERHPELMAALRVNLGTFGIMYDITFKVEPAIKVRVENYFMTVRDLLMNQSRLKSQIEDSLMGELSYFPFNSITLEQEEEYTRTGKVPDTWRAADDEVWVRTTNIASETELQGQTIQGKNVLPTNGSLSGGSRKGLLKAKGSIELARKLPRVSYHYLVSAFPVIDPPRWGTETSAAFLLNIDTDFNRPYRAIKYLVERTEEQIRTTGTTPMNALLPRFFRNSDDCFLCLGNTGVQASDTDNGHSLVIDFLAPPTQQGFYDAAADFVKEFKGEKVRPHWAKRHDNIPGIIELIQDVYGPLLPAFMEQRSLARVDPCDMFTNSYLIEILGRSEDCFYV